jgi:GT2 family glycosyltransferase
MNNANKRMDVSVVIPNYNGESLLKKNLPSLIAAYKNKANCIREIIIVDDASTDKSVDLIKRNFPEVKLIQHKKNRRFAASVNTGARSSLGNVLCLLNTDVIPSKNFLEKALTHFKDSNVFGVSLHEKGFGWAKGIFNNGFIEHSPGIESEDPHPTFWISGGSGLFRRNIWMELKGMDEELFKNYWDDLDLSYRAQKRGYKLIWEPNAKVIHEHETTNKRVFTKREMLITIETNQLLFIWKNLTSPIMFRKHISGLVKRVSSHPGYLLIVIRALTKIKLINRGRKIERRESHVSDETIFASFN